MHGVFPSDRSPVHGSFGAVDYRAKTRGPLLYLLFSVRDDDVVYHDPRQARRATGDRLVLRTGKGREYVITTAAPGPVQGRVERSGYELGWEPRIRGQWQDSMDGFTIELELPLALLGERLGFYVVNDSVSASSQISATSGNIDPGQRTLPWLVYPPLALQALLAPFASAGIHLQVVDSNHWIIATAGNLEREVIEDQAPWLLRAIYRAILNGDTLPNANAAAAVGQIDNREVGRALARQTSADWYSDDSMPGLKLLSAAAPILSGGDVAGAVLATQNSEQYLSLTDRAFSRLLYYSLTAMLISALGLLARRTVGDYPADGADAVHLQIEAMKLALADAKRFVAEPASMDTPPEALLDPDYLTSRSDLIDMGHAGEHDHGQPAGGDTVYLTTADAAGMMVSYIQSNYLAFGSGVVVPGTGISLHNRGACFSLEPGLSNYWNVVF